ncbi:hypothetical protein [Klebsiella pneumoniae]|uniref:hypothetical protein n=1 Tax=Klebsiella pneumoniae TaxID=573 RepID=UPI000E2A7F91|nr:hypothetical protein [Klebsiella pneumoniae]EKX6528499.1 hypothetical protein [Klebsiella pneumoniae]EKX6688119.1 hypothetical protein [Klebsiella pneumoniae]MBS2754307.1 hypothetical protein [Klebsiella pneumoniae]MBS2759780.1 hypothetical protein [Klebsiella pneumoniae]MBS2769707.1 hypothetical protein [Klebsiella pneumoniae]
MTDITELVQREKFEAWFVNDVVGADVNFPAFKDGEYTEGEIYDEQLYFMLQAMWMAWKAAGAELVEALEKAQQRIDSQREYYEGVIADGGKRIADLESRTVKLPEPEQWDITQVLLCKKKVVAAIRAAGIKVEVE